MGQILKDLSNITQLIREEAQSEIFQKNQIQKCHEENCFIGSIQHGTEDDAIGQELTVKDRDSATLVQSIG